MEMFDFILIIEKNVDSLLPIFKGKLKISIFYHMKILNFINPTTY